MVNLARTIAKRDVAGWLAMLMRRAEVCRLRREQVALSQGVIQLHKSKTGPAVVVLNGETQRILQEHLASHASDTELHSTDN
jgi:integrase